MVEKIVKVKAGETKILPLIWWGGDKNSNVKIKAVLDQPRATLKIIGLLYGKKNRFNLELELVHKAQQTKSETAIKGVLDDSAYLSVISRVIIKRGSKKSVADLSQRFILLSKKARVDTIPGMEISEHRVKARHEASVERINPDQLFYLATRGLTPGQARRIITEGFLNSQVKKLSARQQESIKRKLSELT